MPETSMSLVKFSVAFRIDEPIKQSLLRHNLIKENTIYLKCDGQMRGHGERKEQESQDCSSQSKITTLLTFVLTPERGLAERD